MYIKLYRLTDGTQVVGKDETHFIKDALQVTLNRQVDHKTQQEGIAIGVVPLLYPFQQNHKGTDIDRTNIVCSMDCPNELLNVYMQATSQTVNMQVPTLSPVESTQQGPL